MSHFQKPQIIPHLESSVDFTLFDCSWVPSSVRFVVLGTKVDGKGVLRIYSMGGKELTQLEELLTEKALKCCTFGATTLEDRHLATGDFGGSLAIYDLEKMTKPLRTIKAHEDLINAIDGVGGVEGGVGSLEIATASRDGKVKIWDIRIPEKPVACMQPSETFMKRDAWAVAFGDSHSESDRLVACGYDNGDLKIIDLRTMTPLWETELPSNQGICSIQFDRKDILRNKLLATCLEGNMYMWDLRILNPTSGFASVHHKQAKSTLWCGRYLPQNRDVFLSATGSGEISLWKYDYPMKRSKEGSDGHAEGVPGEFLKLQDAHFGDQPISSFSWSLDKCGLGLCTSFDQKIRTVIVTKLNSL